MDDKTLRKAVELADGWSLVHICDGEDWGQEFGDNSGVPTQQVLIQDPHKFQSSLDALAAQLTRQVDATDYEMDFRCDGGAEVLDVGRYTEALSICVSHDDRTANSIQAIIDSKVLERDDE